MVADGAMLEDDEMRMGAELRGPCGEGIIRVGEWEGGVDPGRGEDVVVVPSSRRVWGWRKSCGSPRLWIRSCLPASSPLPSSLPVPAPRARRLCRFRATVAVAFPRLPAQELDCSVACALLWLVRLWLWPLDGNIIGIAELDEQV